MTEDVLPITGERTVPGVAEENYWFRRHEVVYEALAVHVGGATVLEAGCGAGYGADLLSRSASRVVALDYDAHTAAHVARHHPHLGTTRANLASLPVRTGSVQVVVTLQVVEHLWDQPQFLAECRRVLAPGGKLLISTPNRITFSPGRDTPLNPFHTRELSPAELAELLREGGFVVEQALGLHHGPRLRALDDRWGGSFVDAQLDRALAGQPWPARLHADVASVAGADFALREDDLDASLDLVSVAVRG